MALDPDPSAKKSGRMSYLDNLRSLVIFLVVVMHSNVTYSGLGGWYYKEGSPGTLDTPSLVLFGFYGSFTQAWFMGLMFFLAAYFAARSLPRKGTGAFIKERLFRLGVPLLVYMLVIEPIIGYFLMNYDNVRAQAGPLQAWLGYLASFRWLGATGPLWFVEALLLFTLPYAAYRALRPSSASAPGSAAAPAASSLLAIAAAAGLAAFSIRLFQPIGSSFLNLQLGFFASYVALFLLGLHAGERGWLEAFAETRGRRWMAAGLGIGVLSWNALMAFGGALSGGGIPIEGGMHWQSFAYAFWEAFVAISMSLGLVGFFKRYANTENRLTRLLAANSFGVYMFNAPVLIGISLLLARWHGPLLLKHAVVAPTAYLATLALSELVLRRIPGLKSAIK
jgi:glucans biosynthesis protein C